MFSRGEQSAAVLVLVSLTYTVHHIEAGALQDAAEIVQRYVRNQTEIEGGENVSSAGLHLNGLVDNVDVEQMFNAVASLRRILPIARPQILRQIYSFLILQVRDTIDFLYSGIVQLTIVAILLLSGCTIQPPDCPDSINLLQPRVIELDQISVIIQGVANRLQTIADDIRLG